MNSIGGVRFVEPFNGPIEIGLRVIAVLNEAFPLTASLQRLVIFDYLLVHSDDISGGPEGLHPKTPHRGGELLVRRDALQQGIALYRSRGLLESRYETAGVFFGATERSAGFLDTLQAQYLLALRDRAAWVVSRFGSLDDTELEEIVRDYRTDWGAEFAHESVLWAEPNL